MMTYIHVQLKKSTTATLRHARSGTHAHLGQVRHPVFKFLTLHRVILECYT